jgi:rod shape-determining protein MreC
MGAVVVGWIILLGQPTAFAGKCRAVFARLVTPFVKIGDYIPVIHYNRSLAAENAKLRDDNTRLQQQLATLAEAGRENINLHALLNYKKHVPLRTVGAHVTGHDAGNWWKSIQLDRGSADGLRENLAVVNADGLVGKVVSVTQGEARVLLLIDPNCKVSALLQDTREAGVLAGRDEAFTTDPSCLMTFVNRNAKPRKNETVITSGLGGIFPKGIVIGTVVSAGLNPQTGMFQDIVVKPHVDFRRLEEVLVILE